VNNLNTSTQVFTDLFILPTRKRQSPITTTQPQLRVQRISKQVGFFKRKNLQTLTLILCNLYCRCLGEATMDYCHGYSTAYWNNRGTAKPLVCNWYWWLPRCRCCHSPKQFWLLEYWNNIKYHITLKNNNKLTSKHFLRDFRCLTNR